MTCHILAKKVVYGQNETVDSTHSLMFHGEIDTNFPADDNNLGDDLVNALHLRKNIYSMGEVLKPHRNLVVSEALKSRLRRFENMQFFRVVFSCLFEQQFQPGRWLAFQSDYDQ